MKTTAGFAGILALLAADVAWAGDFGRREIEVEADFENNLHDLVKEEEAARLTDAIDRYFSDRTRALDDLLALVADESADQKDQGQKWKEIVSRVLESLKGSISSCPDSIRDANPLLVKFCEKVSVEEVKFWDLVGASAGPYCRDEFVRRHQAVKEMIANLDVKWSEQKGNDDGIDDREKRVVEEVLGLMDAAIDDHARGMKDITEKFYDLNGKIAKTLGARPVSEVLSDGKTALDKSVSGEIEEIRSQLSRESEWLLSNANQYLERRRALQEILAAERVNLGLFVQSRRDTTQFLTTAQLSNLEAVARGSSEWHDQQALNLVTDGQKSDWSNFSREIKDRMTKHLDIYTRIFNDFVSRHGGRFFGPFSDQAWQEMLEPGAWNDAQQRVTGKGLSNKIAELRKQMTDITNWGGSMPMDEPLKSIAVEYAKEKLRNHFDRLIEQCVKSESVWSDTDLRLLFAREETERMARGD